MIIGVCAAKGSPGVSTVALATALACPGSPVLIEADPSGADAPFRLRAPSGGWLDAEPWLGSLASAARIGVVDPRQYAQDTLIGAAVVPGGRTPDEVAPLGALWPVITETLSAAECPVVVDFGRFTDNHAAERLLAACDVVLLVSRTDTSGLAHTRHLASTLVRLVGLGPDRAPKVMVVTTADRPRDSARHARRDATVVLDAAGLPCPVIGHIPADPKAAAGLVCGPMTRYVAGSPLIRAARDMLAAVWAARADLAAPLPTRAGRDVGEDPIAPVVGDAATPVTYRDVAEGEQVTGRG